MYIFHRQHEMKNIIQQVMQTVVFFTEKYMQSFLTLYQTTFLLNGWFTKKFKCDVYLLTRRASKM